jgi:hypothetical protein
MIFAEHTNTFIWVLAGVLALGGLSYEFLDRRAAANPHEAS